MLRQSAIFSVFSLILLQSAVAFAWIHIDGSSTDVALGSGLLASGNADPSQFKGNLFRTPELIKNQLDGTMTGTVPFSHIPVIDRGLSGLFFQLIYDQQETKFNEQVSIDDLVISVGGTTIWDYDQATNGSLLLNSNNTDFTATTLGAGGDMELLIPVLLFDGMGYTGSDMMSLTATQSQSNNGGEEWAVTTAGRFYSPDEPINPKIPPGNVVPEPSAMALWLTVGMAGIGVGWLRRRRTNA